MYTRSDNIEIMFGDDNDDIIEQLFESLLQKYEENLQSKMRGSEFEFNDDKCFQYAVKLALNLDKTKKDPKEYLKLNPLEKNIIGKI